MTNSYNFFVMKGADFNCSFNAHIESRKLRNHWMYRKSNLYLILKGVRITKKKVSNSWDRMEKKNYDIGE